MKWTNMCGRAAAGRCGANLQDDKSVLMIPFKQMIVSAFRDTDRAGFSLSSCSSCSQQQTGHRKEALLETAVHSELRSRKIST